MRNRLPVRQKKIKFKADVKTMPVLPKAKADDTIRQSACEKIQPSIKLISASFALTNLAS